MSIGRNRDRRPSKTSKDNNVVDPVAEHGRGRGRLSKFPGLDDLLNKHIPKKPRTPRKFPRLDLLNQHVMIHKKPRTTKLAAEDSSSSSATIDDCSKSLCEYVIPEPIPDGVYSFQFDIVNFFRDIPDQLMI